MLFTEINYLAVAVATAVAFFIAFAWYGPLFGKPWMKLAKVSEKEGKKDPVKKMILGIMNTFVLAMFTELFVNISGVSTWIEGALLGLLLAIGFTATTLLSNVIWEKQNFNLYLIHVGYRVVILVAMGAILSSWAW